MPLKNYTTKVSVFQSVGEIQSMLAKAGATKILQELDSGFVVGISFEINTPYGLRQFSLPAHTDKVMAVLKKQKVNVDKPQAERVAWRILKDWTAAQMAILETEMVTVDEVFLPYMLNGSGTLYSAYVLSNGGQILIGGADNET
ncbi:MAG: hypothetical protein IJN27_01755 [Oscillospiraceae bacterium]|nr:hypothetical protein [Oscillospiraceae bacterium]